MLHEMYRCILCGRCVRACVNFAESEHLPSKKWMEECRLSLMEQFRRSRLRFHGTLGKSVQPVQSVTRSAYLKEGLSREAIGSMYGRGCPAHINVPKYIRFIRGSNYAAAAATVRKVPFPETWVTSVYITVNYGVKRNGLDNPYLSVT